MRSLWLFWVFLLLGGCAGAPPPPAPVPITAAIVAAAELNPEVNGEPRQVGLHLFQLRSPDKFNLADSATLRGEAAATALGADMIASDTKTVKPGDSIDYKTEIDPQARYLGIVAAFREAAGGAWRTVVPLPESEQAEFFRTNKLTITLDARSVSAAFGKP